MERLEGTLDRIPKLMRLGHKTISEDGSFKSCRRWRTGGIPLGFSGVCRIGDDGQNLRVPRVSLCPSLSGCKSWGIPIPSLLLWPNPLSGITRDAAAQSTTAGSLG